MDASNERGYGAMVTQIPVWNFEPGKRAGTVLDPTAADYDQTLERPVCFLSKRLNKHEQNYWPTELEGAGLVWTIRKIRHLVDDASSVVVFTDHFKFALLCFEARGCATSSSPRSVPSQSIISFCEHQRSSQHRWSRSPRVFKKNANLHPALYPALHPQKRWHASSS
jgi:hypothetical protein